MFNKIAETDATIGLGDPFSKLGTREEKPA